MEAAIRRRFTLLDATILVASTAGAFAASRSDIPDLLAVIRSIDIVSLADAVYVRNVILDTPHTLHFTSIVHLGGYYVGSAIYGRPNPWAVRARGQAVAIADDLTVIVLPFLVLWTLALLVLRLRHPRPSWKELGWQPGLWTCGTAVIALLALSWIDLYFSSDLPPAIISCAVGAAWMILAVSRRSSPEPSWIDGAGRCLRVAWMVMIPFYFVLRFWGR